MFTYSVYLGEPKKAEPPPPQYLVLTLVQEWG